MRLYILGLTLALAATGPALAQRGRAVRPVDTSVIMRCMLEGVSPDIQRTLFRALGNSDTATYYATKKDIALPVLAERCDPQPATREISLKRGASYIDMQMALAVLAPLGLTQKELDAVSGPDVEPAFADMRLTARRQPQTVEGAKAASAALPLLVNRFKDKNLPSTAATSIVAYYVSRETFNAAGEETKP